MRVPQRVLIVLLAFSLSCSDDDGTGPPPGPVTEATVTIQPKGGSVTVENEAGVSMRVTLPRGAVLSATPVTLKAVDPPPGVRARFVLEPAGLDLLAPAAFTVTLPEGASIAANSGFVFTNGEPVHVPADVDPVNRTLTASLYQLGFDPPAAVALATSLRGGEEPFIDVDALECDFIREALDNQILRAQAFSSPFPPSLATPIIQEFRTALLVCESPDSIAAASAVLRELACSNSASAQNHVLIISTAADLKTKLGELLSAEALVQVTAADCHVAENKIEEAFVEFVNAYVERINDENFVANFPTWDALWKEVVPCLEIRALADAFELPDVTAKINSELLPALFARLHEVASNACAEDENNSFLLDFALGGHILDHAITPEPEFPSHTGFTQDAIVEELLTCGGSAVVEAKTSSNELIGTTEISSGDEGSVLVITAGKLVITDSTLGYTCSGGIVSRTPMRVRAEVPSQLPVAQLGNLSGSLALNVATIVNQLPTVEGDPPADFDIVIERDRNVCGIDDPGKIELFRIHVNTQGFTGSMAGVWNGGCPGGAVSGTFTIQIGPNGDIVGTFDGSAAGDIAGHVNQNGTFDASANGTAGSCEWQGSVNLDGGVVSGSGTWTCSEASCAGGFASGGLTFTTGR